jgi:hypothetical protein
MSAANGPTTQDSVPLASLSQSLNLGVDLRRRLEAVAVKHGFDATGYGRRLIREQLEREEQSNGRTSRL